APEASAPPAPAGPAASDDFGTPSSAGSPPATAPPTASQPSGAPEPAPSSEPGELTADHVRRRWPEVLETLTTVKRTTWALISQHAQVVALDASTLQLGFSTGGLASAFSKGGHSEHVQRALAETLGLQVRVEPVVSDGTAPPTPPTSGAPAQSSPAQASPAPAPGGTSWEPQNSPAAAAPPPQDAAQQSAPPRSASPADEDAGAAKDQPEDTATAAPPWDVDESEEPTAQSVPAQPAPASRGEAGSDAAVDRAADTVADLGSAGEPGPVPPAEEDPAGEP